MAVLSRALFKKVEWYLYNYFNIRREIQEYRDSVLYSDKQLLETGGHGVSRHSDPTAMKALKLASGDIVKLEKWVKVIELTKERYGNTEKGRLLKMRYFDELGEKQICQELHIDRATYYNWRVEIVVFTAMLAIQYGLIKLDKKYA